MRCQPRLNPDPTALAAGVALGAKLRRTSDPDAAVLMVRTGRIDSLETMVAALSSAVSGLERALAASRAEALCMNTAQARAITGLRYVIQDMRDDLEEGFRRASASTAGPIPRTPMHLVVIRLFHFVVVARGARAESDQACRTKFCFFCPSTGGHRDAVLAFEGRPSFVVIVAQHPEIYLNGFKIPECRSNKDLDRRSQRFIKKERLREQVRLLHDWHSLVDGFPLAIGDHTCACTASKLQKCGTAVMHVLWVCVTN